MDKCAGKIFPRAASTGKPEYAEQTVGRVTDKAVKVSDAVYAPDKAKTGTQNNTSALFYITQYITHKPSVLLGISLLVCGVGTNYENFVNL